MCSVRSALLWFLFVVLGAFAPPARATTIRYEQFVGGDAADGASRPSSGLLRDGVFTILGGGGRGMQVHHSPTLEVRTSLEMPVGFLGTPEQIRFARLVIHTTAGTRPASYLRLDGYLGNGVVEPQDFAPDNEIAREMIPETGATGARTVFDVTEFIEQFAAIGPQRPTHLGFTFRQINVDDVGDGITISDFEGNEGIPPPVLEITYWNAVPEPGAGALALTAALGGGLLTMRRRSRARAS